MLLGAKAGFQNDTNADVISIMEFLLAKNSRQKGENY